MAIIRRKKSKKRVATPNPMVSRPVVSHPHISRAALWSIIVANVVITLTLFMIILCYGQNERGREIVNGIFAYAALPIDAHTLTMRPWTIFTYMFVQVTAIQLACNMLWLWVFGTLLRMRVSSRVFVCCYILGGMGAALGFELGRIFGWYSTAAPLAGASAATLAVTAATAIVLPRLYIPMIVVGRIRVGWIALVALLIVVIVAFETDTSLPTTLAHTSGAITGALFGCLVLWRKRIRHHKRERERNTLNADEMAEYGSLAARARTSGYASLNSQERTRLFLLTSRAQKSKQEIK